MIQGLKKRLKEILPGKQEEVKHLRKSIGNKLLGTCTVEQVRHSFHFCLDTPFPSILHWNMWLLSVHWAAASHSSFSDHPL
jgi:hypothetical protein